MTIIVTTTASASSRDYDWLKSSIAKWAHRTNLTDVIPDFVMMAEKRINDDLEATAQEGIVEMTTVKGQQYLAAPSDLADIRSLTVTGVGSLAYLLQDQFADLYAHGHSGAPLHYTVVGAQILFGPIPDSEYIVKCYARLRVPALADAAGTNWLIIQRPDVYLAASMVNAMVYMKDLPGQQQWEAAYQTAMTSLNAAEWGKNAPLTIKPSTTTV